jgi:hypothetical protein
MLHLQENIYSCWLPSLFVEVSLHQISQQVLPDGYACNYLIVKGHNEFKVWRLLLLH